MIGGGVVVVGLTRHQEVFANDNTPKFFASDTTRRPMVPCKMSNPHFVSLKYNIKPKSRPNTYQHQKRTKMHASHGWLNVAENLLATLGSRARWAAIGCPRMDVWGLGSPRA